MGFLDTVRSWFATEAAEARDLGNETKDRLEAELDRRDAELAASPAEKLDMLQQQIADNDSSFDELRDKIEGRSAHANAVDEIGGPGSDEPAGPDEPSD